MPDKDFYILMTTKANHRQSVGPYIKEEAVFLLGENTKPVDPKAKITDDKIEADAWDKSCTICHESFEVR